MTLKYVGHKAFFPVDFPIGVNRKSSVIRTVFADPFVELEQKDAEHLMSINPGKFEVVEPEVEQAPVKKPKKRGRPRKTNA